ncbi:MAG: nucleotide exchange factor GrpE [Candidatus Eisenbacteria bacterium]
MTEDIRDAARQAMGGDADHQESVVKNAPEASEPVEAFAAETAKAETLDPAQSVEGETSDTAGGRADANDTASGDAAGGRDVPEPKVPDYKDKWLRSEAELQNFRRRAQRDRDDAVRFAEDRILLDLIELLDDVERALAALTSEQAADPWTQGVVLTATRMREALSRRGVTVIETHGQAFDPSFHEALLEVPAPAGIAPGCVAQEVLKGYRRGDRALRAARVVVARAEG